uniref:Mab-21 domain-containing protein n=1 Tax=Globodera pallida TaxID=36090 RepID=A0A183CMQ6_GLOPA
MQFIATQQINQFYAEKVQLRRQKVQKVISSIADTIKEVLKQVEQQEPRFICTFAQLSNGNYEGLLVHSPYEFEVILYLNQMGVFNFVDDGSIPGCAVLKLSDGRKRSMSLWVEFITASGYLSARKIRARFQALVAQTIEKAPFSDKCKIVQDTSDVKLVIYGKYIVQITCAFRCSGIWPRSASHWPTSQVQWPSIEMAKEIRLEGFDLLSKDLCPSTSGTAQQQNNNNNNKQYQQQQQTTQNQQQQQQQQTNTTMMEGDAWVMSTVQAEDKLLHCHANRDKVYSILKALRDRHLDFTGSATTSQLVKVLVLYECEKHYHNHEWNDFCLGDRIIGILLQMVNCLQCRRCPNFFLPQLDLLKNRSSKSLDESARAVWALVRQLMLNAKALEQL